MQNIIFSTILKVIFFLLAFHYQAFGKPVVNPQQDQKGKAIALFNNGQFASALPLFSKLVYDYPYDFSVKYYTGACLVETGVFSTEAEKNLLLASGSAAPARVWYYLGRLYHAGENWNSAQRYYNRFRNNADSTEVRELRVDELIQFCYSHINPFVENEKGNDSISQTGEKEKISTSPVTPQPDTVIIPAVKKEDIPDRVKLIQSSSEARSEVLPAVPLTGKMNVKSEEKDSVLNNRREIAESSETKKDSLVEQSGNRKAIVSEEKNGRREIPEGTDTVKSPVRVMTKMNRQSASHEFINFQINDRITYLIEEMFQAEEALNEYKIGKQKSQQLDSLIDVIGVLRNQYHYSKHPGTRDSLGKKIKQFENSTLALKNEIQHHFVVATAIENRWWQDTEFSVYETFLQVSDSLKKLQTLPVRITRKEDSSETVSIGDSAQVQHKTQIDAIPSKPKAAISAPSDVDEIIYKVQLGICDKTISPRRKILLDKISKIRSVESYVNANGRIVCTTGNLRKFDDAYILQNQIRQEGIKDAFVIATKNGKRISLPPENKTKP